MSRLVKQEFKRKVRLFFDFAAPKFGDVGKSMYLCGVRLLSRCELTDELTDEQLRFVTLIEPMYIEARYPEQKLDAAKMLNEEASEYLLQSTKTLTQWIKEHLPSNKL